MLYAYRWQIGLFFRFLKRTLNGIHPMSHDPKGIRIRFYIYMTGYLLLPAFSQECHTAAESDIGSDKIRTEEYEDSGLPQKTQNKGSERPYVCGSVSFIGEKLKKRKIGLHWLTAVKNHPVSDLDIQTVRKLSAFL